MAETVDRPDPKVMEKLAKRPRDMICWRVAAIYRCCVNHEKSRDWALARLREICPKGYRDHMVDIWWMGIENIRKKPVVEEHVSFDMAA